jgi:hypothetical protein
MMGLLFDEYPMEKNVAIPSFERDVIWKVDYLNGSGLSSLSLRIEGFRFRDIALRALDD